jgi:lysophospholipid acyltransferase (LPLAT)-like uncharacterized protein
MYRRAKGNPARRRILAVIGKAFYRPVLLPVAKARQEKQFSLHVTGRANIPAGPAIINIHHQTHQDAIAYLVAIGEYVNVLAASDGNSKAFDWILLEMLGVIGTFRGSSRLAKKRQREAYEEIVARLKRGSKIMVAGEGTYCPLFNDVLKVYAGSTVRAAQEVGVPIINAVGVYIPDSIGAIQSCHIDFMKPFETSGYSDLTECAEALRISMREKKREMIGRYIPGTTQADYSKFRAAQHLKFNADHDYYDNAHLSLNYKLAECEKERVEVLNMFRSN